LRRHHKRTGAPPGTLTAPSDAVASVMTMMAFKGEALVEDRVTSVGEIRGIIDRHDLTWLNVVGLADVALIREIGRVLGLHRLPLEDVFNTSHRPKVEDYTGFTFLTLRHLTAEAAEIEAEQLSLFLGDRFVLTFQERESAYLEPAKSRLRQGRNRIRTSGADYLAYVVLDVVIDSYYPLLEHFGERLDALEEAVIETKRTTVIPDIRDAKRDLLFIRRAIWPLRDALSHLYREPNPLISERTQLFIRDCYDHTVQLVDLLEGLREMAGELFDVYLSMATNRTSEVSRVLTLVATIFIPLSFIAGLWGMNFKPEKSPLNMPELEWYYGYPMALTTMASVAVGMLIYFKRRGWLRRNS
jgi:magnesium transporter